MCVELYRIVLLPVVLKWELAQVKRKLLQEQGRETQGQRTDLLSINDKKLNGNDLFECNKCNEQFDSPVWHCANCDHHWPIEDDTCKNCHKNRSHNTREELSKDLGWSTGKVAQAEQKLRTQRILGELLKENEDIKPGRPKEENGKATRPLSDYGLSKYESSTFQKIAALLIFT